MAEGLPSAKSDNPNRLTQRAFVDDTVSGEEPERAGAVPARRFDRR
jgi:hypothetical protein